MKTQVESVTQILAAAAGPPVPAQNEGPPESVVKHLLGVLTALCGIGIPASAVVPAFHKIGLTPPAMVFLCAAFGVLAAAWPGKHSRRWRPASPAEATPGPRFESRSRRWLFGMPLYHIVRGINPATGVAPVARGIVAIGPVARGWFALGGRAHGVIAIGGMAMGVVTFGGISLGLISAGGLAVGLLCAVGGMSVGSLVLGGVMAGLAPLVVMPSGAPLGGTMIFGQMADASGELAAALRRAAMIGGIVTGALAFIVLMCACFSATPALQPVAGNPPAPPANPWPRRIFWLIFMIVLVPALLIFLPMTRGKPGGSKPGARNAYQDLPVRDAATPRRAPFVAKWDQGSAELVAVMPLPDNGQWWRMDGTTGGEWPFAASRPAPASAGPGERAWGFIFHFRDLPKEGARHWRVENAVHTPMGDRIYLKDDPEAVKPEGPRLGASKPLPADHYVRISLALPESLQQVSVKAGMAMDSWHTIWTAAPGRKENATVTFEEMEWTLTSEPAGAQQDGGFQIRLRYNWNENWEVRLAAVAESTNAEGLTSVTTVPGQAVNPPESSGAQRWRFPRVEKVKEFHVQVRPYQWIEFRDIALKQAQP
jgi:hypothetical protein